MDKLIKLMSKYKPTGYRLDKGDDYMDYTREKLQDPAVMFLAIKSGDYLPAGFEAHHEYLGCDSKNDEDYIRVCVRVPDQHQRTLLALQMPVLDKQQILGERHV